MKPRRIKEEVITAETIEVLTRLLVKAEEKGKIPESQSVQIVAAVLAWNISQAIT